MKRILWILGIAVAVLSAAVLAGALLPREQTVTREIWLNSSPEAVWAVITNFSAVPGWWSRIRGVERLPDNEGHEVWREINELRRENILEVTVSEPPLRLVRRSVKGGLSYGGSWTYTLTRDGVYCRLRLTEVSYVNNPIHRLVWRVVTDRKATIESYLEALAQHLGQAPQIR